MSKVIFDTVFGDQYNAEISFDECNFDPRSTEFDEGLMAKFHFKHNKYRFSSELEDVQSFDTSDCESWEDEKEVILSTFKNDIALIKPVFMYQHGCVNLSYGRKCQWDAGQIGFAVLLKSQIRKLHCVKNVTKTVLDKAEKEMDAELKIYSSYLNGDVFSVLVRNKETKEVVDSCGSIIGFDDAKEISKEIIANFEKKCA
jgi:hypothetical protein